MSDELMNRAREFLALRDEATPGPWRRASGTANYRIYGSMRLVAEVNQVEHITRSGQVLADSDGHANANFIAAAHDMADTIADLLAEVERLTIRESALSDAHVEIHGHRFACSQAVANYVQQINDQRVTAESRLRELASAEPVAMLCEYEAPNGELYIAAVHPDVARKVPPDRGEPIPLIRRPEMPS